MTGFLFSAKYRAVALLLIFAAAVALATSNTIAFFTDARESTGVFTAGNVYIELTEAAVTPDAAGNLIENTAANRISGAEIVSGGPLVVHNYGVVFPGQTIHKDPTVKNVGSESAWIAVKVIIEDGIGDIHKLYSYSDGLDDINIELLLQGGLLDEHVHVGDWNGMSDVCYNDNYAMIQASSHLQGKYEFFFIMQKPLESDEEVEVFDTFFVNEYFGNAEMQEFRELKVTVQAFAVQKYGFGSCLAAMTAAFSSHFTTCTGND